jgi:predicted nucleic acid-binding Zn ribbon protein
MPLYLYENEETGEVVEVLQGMKDKHTYNGSNGREKGLWRRVFVNPSVSFDTNTDDTSSKSFVKGAHNKNYTYGDLFEKSAEASAKRADRYGKDPIKEKQYAEYNKKTNGKLHPQQQKENFNKAVERAAKKGIKIEL